MHKHPRELADTTRAYVEATRSTVQFLIVENERMEKDLQTTKQGGEQVTSYAREKLKRAILDEVSSLKTIMQILYSKFGTVHKVVVHLNGWDMLCARRARILSNLHTTVDCMQTWIMRCKGSPLHFQR